jgi:hypothetical protein
VLGLNYKWDWYLVMATAQLRYKGRIDVIDRRGFRLEALEPIASAGDDDDEGIPRVTDIDFNEGCMVSVAGYVVAKTTPWNLFKIHDNERLLKKMREEAERQALLEIRNRPITEKFEELMELAREDPKLAAHHLAQGLRNRAMEIPNAIKALDRKTVIEKTKTKAVQGATGLLKAMRDPTIIVDGAKNTLASVYKVMFPPSKDELALQKMMDDMAEEELQEDLAEGAKNTEGRAARRRGLASLKMEDMTPKPLEHPAAILMTVTVLQEAPAPFEMVPPPKWYDPALHFQKDLQSVIAEVTGKKPPPPRKPPKYRNARKKLALYEQTIEDEEEEEYVGHGGIGGGSDDGSEMDESGSLDAGSTVSALGIDKSLLGSMPSRGRGRDSVVQSKEVEGPLDAVKEDDNEGDDASQVDEDGDGPKAKKSERKTGKGGGEGEDGEAGSSGDGGGDEKSSARDSGRVRGQSKEGDGDDEDADRSGAGDGDNAAEEEEISSRRRKNSAGGAADGGEEDEKEGAEEEGEEEGSGEGAGDGGEGESGDGETVEGGAKEGEGEEGESSTNRKEEDDNGGEEGLSHPAGEEGSLEESEGIKGLISESGLDEHDDHSQSTLTTKPPGDANKDTKSGKPPAGQNALSKYQISSLTKAIWNNYKDRKDGAAAEVVKDIFDTSRRRKFEETLIEELAIAACIPSKFFKIEEVRKFAHNDPQLLELRQVKKDYFDEEDRAAEEKRKKELEEWQRTLDLANRSAMKAAKRREDKAARSNGSVGSLGSVSVISADDSRSINSKDAATKDVDTKDIDTKDIDTSAAKTPTKPEGKSAKPEAQGENSDEEQMEGEDDDAYIERLVGETDAERRARLKKEMRKQSVWGGASDSDSASQSLGVVSGHASHSAPGVQGGGAVNTVPGPLDVDELTARPVPKKEKKKAFRPPGAKKGVLMYDGKMIDLNPSTPLDITFMKLGLPNPGEVDRDPKYWLARELRELTEEERQQKRLKILQTLHLNGESRMNVLEQQLAIIRQKQAELSAVAEMYVGPTLKEMIRRAEPMKAKAKKILESATKRTGEGDAKAAENKGAAAAADVPNQLMITNLDGDGPAKEGSEGVKSGDEKTPIDAARIVDKTDDASARRVMQAIAAEVAGVAGMAASSEEEKSNRDMIDQLREKLAKEEAEVLNVMASTDVDAESVGKTNAVVEKRLLDEMAPPPAFPTLSAENIQKNDEIIMSARGEKLSFDDKNKVDSVDDNVSKLSMEGDKMGGGGEGEGEVKSEVEAEEVKVDKRDPEAILRDEVFQVVDTMCRTVERQGDSLYDIYDEYLQLWDDIEDARNDVVKGCEVSFVVYIDSSLMKHIYLRDLQPEDIGTFLRQQVFDRDSELHHGSITKHIVDIKFKPMFKRRVGYSMWEQLWVHFIHPVYFGYCTKYAKDEKYVGGQSKGRLAGGVIVVNPTDYFTPAQKVTFMGLPQPQSKLEIGAILDYNVDEVGKDMGDTNKLQIFRPNMGELTKKDVEKCKRIARAMKEKYDNEMRLGLVDGKRLRAGQFAALKEYQSAQRIYDLAKQKLARDERAEQEGELLVPQITKITTEQFEGWMKEAKDEEADLLREKKAKAVAQKELRKNEAEMRKRYDHQKTWMFSTILKNSNDNPQQLASHIRTLMEEEDQKNARATSSVATAAERDAADKARADYKKNLIHQEKLTRKMWNFMLARHRANGDQDSDDLTVESGGTKMSASGAGAADPVPHEEAMKYLGLAKVRAKHDEQWAKKVADREKIEKERLRKEKRKLQLERAKKKREAAEKGFALTDEDASVLTGDSSNAPPEGSVELGDDDTSVHSGSVGESLENSSGVKTEDRFSTMSEPIRKFKEEVSFERFAHLNKLLVTISQEMENIQQIVWFKNIISHGEFYECLRQFPTVTPGQITRYCMHGVLFAYYWMIMTVDMYAEMSLSSSPS